MKNKQRFIGSWRLVHSIENTPQGVCYPFGENATGIIHYTDQNLMMVQIGRSDRELFEVEQFTQAAPHELARLPKDYLAYFGTYTIDEQQCCIHHQLMGCLLPNLIGKVLTRRYRFFEDNLSLVPVDGTDREILWKKIK